MAERHLQLLLRRGGSHSHRRPPPFPATLMPLFKTASSSRLKFEQLLLFPSFISSICLLSLSKFFGELLCLGESIPSHWRIASPWHSFVRSRQRHSHRPSFSNSNGGTSRWATGQGQNHPNEAPGNTFTFFKYRFPSKAVADHIADRTRDVSSSPVSS